jgi:phosphohistidine phosphatase
MIAAMLVTLVRHGDANPQSGALDDAGRALSHRGREQARASGRALAEQGAKITHVWTSPLVRAVQTAELMLAQLGFAGAPQTRADLCPDCTPRPLLLDLRGLDPNADVLVVGHMPYMPSLASELLGAHVGGFGTGAAMRLEWGAAQRGDLLWVWRG